MDVETLQEASRAANFRPFTLVLTNGDTIRIEHTEHLHAVSSEVDVVVVVPGGGWRIVDSRTIREIQLPRLAS